MWWDEALQTGAVFDETIEAALNAAKAVVVLWSPKSVASRWVRAEATVADQNNTFLPVMIKACRRPVIFELTQTADLSHWKGNRKDRVWRAFVDDARIFIEKGTDRNDSLAAGLEAGAHLGRAPSPADRELFRSRSAVTAGLAAIVLFAGSAIWWNWPGGPSSDAPLSIADFQAQNGSQAVQFAQTLRDDVIDEMGDAGFPITTDKQAAATRRAGMVLDGSVAEDSSNLRVFAQIRDAKSGVTLWSQQFDGPATESDRLGTAIAISAAEPLYQMREMNLQKGLKLDPDDLAKLMKTQQMINNPRLLDEGRMRQLYEDILANAPNVAYAHANFAVALVQDAARAPSDQREALFARARSQADAAIAIDRPASGAAYDSRYLISVYNEPGNFARQESLLLDGLRNAPQFAYLIMRECQFLMGVGRNEDAWSYCQRAHALRPLTAPIEWRFAEALGMRGEPGLAEQAIEQAVHDYPQNAIVRLAKFDILAFGDGHDRAVALLPAMLNQGEGFGDAEIAALKAYLLARKSGRPGDSDRAAAAIVSAETEDKLRLDLAVEALAALGKKDQAFGLLNRLTAALPPLMDLAPANAGTAFLFAPATAPLRADPRFWVIARRQGLTSYWMSTGNWPDFCGKEMQLSKCKAAAAGPALS